jgi:YVTN family beta-propeller protein
MAVTGSFPTNGYPAAIAVSPDSSQVWVTSRGDGTLQVFDAATLALITSFNLPFGTGVAFNPTGSMVYAASGNTGPSYIQVIDATLLQPVAQIPVGSLPHVVAVTPSGHHVFVTNALSNNISVISTSTNKVIQTLTLHNGAIHPLGLTFIR